MSKAAVVTLLCLHSGPCQWLLFGGLPWGFHWERPPLHLWDVLSDSSMHQHQVCHSWNPFMGQEHWAISLKKEHFFFLFFFEKKNKKKTWYIFISTVLRWWMFRCCFNSVFLTFTHVAWAFKKSNSFWSCSEGGFLDWTPPHPSALPLSAQHAGRQAQHDARGGGEVDRQPYSQRQARRQDRLQTGEAPLIHLSHLSLISLKSHRIKKKKMFCWLRQRLRFHSLGFTRRIGRTG